MEIDINDYDIDGIIGELEDYYGTAMYNASPFAQADLVNLDNLSGYEILAMAKNIGIDIDKYYIGKRY